LSPEDRISPPLSSGSTAVRADIHGSAEDRLGRLADVQGEQPLLLLRITARTQIIEYHLDFFDGGLDLFQLLDYSLEKGAEFLAGRH